MGLTNSSIGTNAIDSGLEIKKKNKSDKVIALAGNPNVGKSTVFNGLTGMNQHTGNWPGKTVTNAQGYCQTKNQSYVMVDIPGTYSLMAHSAEEEVARNFICFGNPDAVIVVCDATCLERNLNLVLQTMEISRKVIVCINLMDEAKRKNITINLERLSQILGVPVVSTVARKKKSLDTLMRTLDRTITENNKRDVYKIRYTEEIETAISMIEPVVKEISGRKLNSRWLSLKLLDKDPSLINEINSYFGEEFLHNKKLTEATEKAEEYLKENNITADTLNDNIVSSVVKACEEIASSTIRYQSEKYNAFDRRMDKILTGRIMGYPVMIIMLALIFWITISGANYPSEALSNLLFYFQDKLTDIFNYINAPQWLHGAVVLGIYRVLAWVVSVMLPPMAIFFPLFTLLEDAGYLPRIAYNLDKTFKKCCACGKQSLTMCMGFGCNAAGVVGCRIIDSPRERLLAILTNNFVPCNGRFPTLITIITMFFVGSAGGISTLISASILTCIIVFGIFVTFMTTKLLSKTLLKGTPSSFTLELPPYRKPQIGKVIVRSIFDRTLFVLARAASVAAPAGLVIWILANVDINGITLLTYCTDFLDPFARLMGLDGVILVAFILGFPANEIVLPIIIMAYTAQGTLVEMESVMQMKELFVANGWTWMTAVSVMLFSLMHWPCSTTVLTIKKETGSVKWTLLSVALPTVIGIVCCIIFNFVAGIFI